MVSWGSHATATLEVCVKPVLGEGIFGKALAAPAV